MRGAPRLTMMLFLVFLVSSVMATEYKEVKISAVGVVNTELLEEGVTAIEVDNVTLVYSYHHDSLYMGVYTTGDRLVLRPILGPCVCGVFDFLLYDESLFFVANDGSAPHYACDEVVRIDPKSMEKKRWVLSWDARNRINPDNAGNIPYATVHLGLDERGNLWARVDLLFENLSVYYIYSNGNFSIVNSTPGELHLPKTRRLNVTVKNGSFYLIIPVEREPHGRGLWRTSNGKVYGLLVALGILLAIWFTRGR